jgi:hypothetical protein
LSLRLNSLPPVGLECRAFPVDGQEPVECSPRFNLTVRCERSDGGVYHHAIGTAFHNPPRGELSENFNLLFDSLPLTDSVRGYPPRAAEDDAEAAA